MRQELSYLVELQKIDLDIKRLEEEKFNSPKRLEALKDRLAQIEANCNTLQERASDLDSRRKEVEEELNLEKTRLSKSQSRLMDIKTDREYQALLKEIEEIKKANKLREEEIDSLKKEQDTIDLELMEEQEKASTVEKEMSLEEKHVGEVVSTLEEQIGKLEKDRGKVAKKVPSTLLKRYDFLRDHRAGVAVVPVIDAVCTGCHMNIPPQLFNDLLKDERVYTCPTCQRIIYASNDNSEDDK